MTGRNIISRELADSIRQCLGRKVKLSLKLIVKAEVKSDKFENRVLGFSTCRLFVLTLKVPTRVDQHFHYLDIQAIESRKPNQLCLTVCDRQYTFYTGSEDTSSSHEVDMMVLSLVTALKNIFPSIPIKHIIRKMDLQPAKRLHAIEELDRATLIVGSGGGSGPCGGFSDQYACMCDYHALPYRAEVAWDVDTIYLSHDTRELYLHDFDYLEQKDLIPILSALEYNTWFVRLRASNSKLQHEAADRLLRVIAKSLSIEELYIDNIGAKAEFANKLSLALLSNSNIPLQKLDVSHNPIEDKGAVHISNPIGRQAKGLSHLNLSFCGLTSKGINMLAHSLTVNKYMCQTLTFLSLSGNSLKDEVNNLYNFLAQPNVLKTLDLSATECAIDAVFGALLRGCTTHLSHLNLSRNGFGNKKSKEMFPSFKQYFTSTIALSTLNMSFCKLPADALKNVLLGLACNENISEVKLDLSNNHLSATGAQILESCIHGVRCLVSLDIQDNGLENQLGPVVLAISKNKSIKTLNIGRNLSSIKSKHVATVMEAVVHMIQEEDCVLESLTFNDSRLKLDLHSLLNALGSNRCLQNLDISGNYMGDSGARLLAKALQINSKLQYISYDRNNITLLGYNDIAYALQSNYSLRFVPFPVHDAMLCMKTAPERTEAVMRRIQDALCRNISPRKYSDGQAFRLQQGFLLSSTQQQVDRLVLQTGEAARTLKRTNASANTSTEANAELLSWSDNLIADAENSKQLISHFHDALRRSDVANPIETKLKQVAKELHTVIQHYIQDTVERLVRSAQDKCPNVLSDEAVLDDIRAACLNKQALVPPQFVEECVVELAGASVLNRVSEVSLAVASTVSDRVVDEVVDALTNTCNSLQTGSDGPRRRAMTGVEGERPQATSGGVNRNSSDVGSHGDSNSQKSSDPSPVATPQLASKRKSLHGRKLRPQSVVAESLDSVSELPSTGGQLQHLAKGRPRRVKTRAPTRPMGRANTVLDEENIDISSGVDHFFRPGSATPTTPLVSPDSDNSPRMANFGSTSSMDSCPAGGVGGRESSGDRGSVESLTATRSEADVVTTESPPAVIKGIVEEEKEADQPNGEEKISVSSMIGKLSSSDVVSKLSPDLAAGKRISSYVAEDKAKVEDIEASKRPSGGQQSKYGGRGGIASNILAEMKARQEKRSSSIFSKDEEEKEDDPPSSGGLLGGVKLRSTGLSNHLKSPTNGFASRNSKSPPNHRLSTPTQQQEGETNSVVAFESGGVGFALTSLLAPVCTPLAMESRDEEDDATSPGGRSVREMAASLGPALAPALASVEAIVKNKTSSLPRNGENDVASSGASGSSHLHPASFNPAVPHFHHLLEGRDFRRGEVSPSAGFGDGGVTSSNHLFRQTSHKHVISTDLSLDDAVDV